MTIPTELLALVTILVIGAFVAQPFFAQVRRGGAGNQRRRADILREQAALLTQRNDIYAAIRDLDFDYKTNKISDEMYKDQRYILVAQGVEILQKLDSLPLLDDPEEDPIEAAVAAYRSGGSEPGGNLPEAGAAGGALFCPQCGTKSKPNDRFCGECGTKLA